MEANIILTALNLILFVLQIAAFGHMCSRISTLNHNDKKALEEYYKYKDAVREKEQALEDYRAKIHMLDKAEEIANILSSRKEDK